MKRQMNMYITELTGQQIEALLDYLGDEVNDRRGYPSTSALFRLLVAEKCAELDLKEVTESNDIPT